MEEIIKENMEKEENGEILSPELLEVVASRLHNFLTE